MSVYLDGPYEASQARVMLPSPHLGDDFNPEIEVAIMNSMNGTVFSTIKTSERVHLNWEFLLSRQKSIELREFVDAYLNYDLKLIDWEDRVYKVKIVNLPIDFTNTRRNGDVMVAVQFEGTQLV